MTPYFLGFDIGGTKSHALIADAFGNALVFAESGPGNPTLVGARALSEVICALTDQAVATAGITKEQISGIGLGISGYNWPSQKKAFLSTTQSLGLSVPLEIVNDTIVALLAGAAEGWGIALVAGTGCNCRGWDKNRREGRVVGVGRNVGEAAGAYDLLFKAIQAVAKEWTRRGPPTLLTQAFIKMTGARNVEDLLEGLTLGVYKISPAMVLAVFQIADEGDPVARELLIWAGQELGSMAIGVIHQLGFETLSFDVILAGSLYKGSSLLVETVTKTIYQVAPSARVLSLLAPPVIGGVLLGMEKAEVKYSCALHKTLIDSTNRLVRNINGGKEGVDE